MSALWTSAEIAEAVGGTATGDFDVGGVCFDSREAGPDDIILLAGKGHEQGQIVGDRVLPFDDVSVARECGA